MSQLLLPLAFAIIAFIGLMLILPKSTNQTSIVRRKDVLNDLERSRQETLGGAVQSHSEIELHDYTMEDAIEDLSSTGRFMIRLPGGLMIYRLIIQAGLQEKTQLVMLCGTAFTLALGVILFKFAGALTIPVSIVIGFFAVRGYLKWRLDKRMRAFMDRFADGIDMIVRAVKAGNPVNTSLRLVAEHGESPVKDEFRILVDEITYGRPLVDALARLAKRVPEYDVSFFVVVLTIQQETGGNLGEVLGKLSHIIRKRQELFLKVRAITSEGRASSWILGALPPGVALAIYFTTPGYLEPLFTTTTGKIGFAVAIIMEIAGFYTIRKMAQIEV